jgi:GNAT superfamily N-acetyltransferase
MKIIEINKDDIAKHAKLFIEVFRNPPWSESWEEEIAYNRLLCYQNTPNFIGLSAIEDDKLIGFIFGNIEPFQKTSHYVLKEMCVKEENQRMGVGKELIQKLHEVLRLHDVGSSILLTQRETPAEIFYSNNGYKLSSTMGLYIKEI